MQFKTLFTVQVEHGYYEANCEDIRFIIPEDTGRRLRNGKLLARTIESKLHVLFEADEDGAALAAIPGKVLRFGLLATNPYFANITELDAGFPRIKRLYRNAALPTELDEPQRTTLVGRSLAHALTVADRPLTATLKDASGNRLQTDVISADANRDFISYDLAGFPAGAYEVEEVSAGGSDSIDYYAEPELAPAGVFGILEVTVASGFYATQAAFEIAFDPREETLNYYVVATAEQASDLDSLSVMDAGAVEDGRDPVLFAKIPSASFTTAEISPTLLGDSSKQVVLFRSQATVPRAEKARRKIQLMKNAEILIPHLPQPGPEKNNADLIIAVSKP